MPTPSQTDVLRAAATMAANQARVNQFIRILDARLDQLVSASLVEDWGQVERLGQQIVAESRTQGYRAVSAMAQRVAEEAAKPDNRTGVRRSVIRLIGAYARAVQPAG